jgi:hypothetical protein
MKSNLSSEPQIQLSTESQLTNEPQLSSESQENEPQSVTSELDPVNNIQLIELMKVLIDSNTEFKKLLIEQQTKIIELSKTQSIVNNTNSIHNTSIVNINMFLNETCKDANTITHFSNSIEPTEEQILYTTQYGSEEGVYSIIEKLLDPMHITNRPFHCTDIKRQTLHVKEEDGWKIEHDQTTLKRLFRTVIHKSSKKVIDMIKANPNYMKAGTNENKYLIQMMTQNEGGGLSNGQRVIEKTEPKVISKICKKIYVDKTVMNQTIIPVMI